MKNKRTISILILAFLVVILSGATVKIVPNTPNTYVSNYENVLGTSFELKVLAASSAQAEQAEEAALAEINRLDNILSAYNNQSEFSQWNRTRNVPIAVSSELFEVLSLFEQWKSRSHGALDASAEVIGRLWKNAAAIKQEPSITDINRAINTVKQQHYRLDRKNLTAIRLDAAPLALNSFAKSYIINKASDAAMRAPGIGSVVVNIGGDLVVRGNVAEQVVLSNPRADAENDAPLAELNISNKAIATSGNYRRGYKIGEKWYSHIIDPRTGTPVEQIISATVVAPNASDAGALATAFNVLSPAESKTLAATVEGAEYLLVTKSGEQITGKGWKFLEVKKELLPLEKSSAPKVQIWDDFELMINLELALFEGRSHRPFVAIWIEDAKKQAVRNISVWYNKPKWLRDMPTWYRIYGSQYTTAPGNNSVSSATRQAGKYNVKWDGKNDKGTFVKAGKYTVFIEVAREHGTHQLMKQEIEVNKKPKSTTLPGNIEITSASLEYRKKTAAN